jgi:hypothetical protein
VFFAIILTQKSGRRLFSPDARELHLNQKLLVRDAEFAGRGPDGRQGSVGAASAAPSCAAPRLCGERKVIAGT